MSYNALYTDLSGYYDLMCADIDYQSQSSSAYRLHQIFGNGGTQHLDLACGTGPHINYLIQQGFTCEGLDINQPMLEIAKQRCPEGNFALGNMCEFSVDQPFDLITCFLYSVHYSGDIQNLKGCLLSVYEALNEGGVFYFNMVDKNQIDNTLFAKHSVQQKNDLFHFSSAWHYIGHGEKQTLNVRIDKTTNNQTSTWQDEHPMVAIHFDELQALLTPYFDVHIFEHNYDSIAPWNKKSGNAIFVCVKR
ncbi:MAG: class I SAM-dependent DNA methyltransferase [Marinomonas sp.]